MAAVPLTPLGISLKTALCATLLSAVAGILVARWRFQRVTGVGSLFDALLLLPLALPPTVIGLLLLVTFGRKSPIGQWLEEIGVPVVFSWPGAVLAAFVVSFPIMYQTARGAFQQIEPSLLDAARVFGRSEWRILVRIMVPLAWPGLAAGVVLSFVRALGEFGATLMLAGNIPGRTQTAPVAIFFAVEAGDLGTAILLSSTLLLFSFAALVTVHLLQRR
ncbi:MAG: molybdate ABC transporter permease subunit [Verrucomicrobiaceae bacterium]|nr:MAG: molybdate ABC transporter permease subunit [Verrucomicrobiaceae bacterium]